MVSVAGEAVKEDGYQPSAFRCPPGQKAANSLSFCRSLTADCRRLSVVQCAAKEELIMAANGLCFLSIAQLAEQIRTRAVSPVEVTRAYLDRIHTLDSQLNSYITVTAERALQEANAAE